MIIPDTNALIFDALVPERLTTAAREAIEDADLAGERGRRRHSPRPADHSSAWPRRCRRARRRRACRPPPRARAFDLVVARVHARLSAELAARGVNVGAHDLQIAATAIAAGGAVATRDQRSFPKIPGLTVHLG